MIFGCKKGRKYSNYLIYTLCCGEGGIGYCADYVGLLRLTPFPTARRRGPCKPNCAKSGKPCLLFPIPLSTSKLVPRYKKQKVSNFSIPFCFVILRRGRDSNPRNSCPFTAFRVRPDRPLRHLSFFCGANIRTFFQNISAKPSFFCALNNKYIVRKVQKSQKTCRSLLNPCT